MTLLATKLRPPLRRGLPHRSRPVRRDQPPAATPRCRWAGYGCTASCSKAALQSHCRRSSRATNPRMAHLKLRSTPGWRAGPHRHPATWRPHHSPRGDWRHATPAP